VVAIESEAPAKRIVDTPLAAVPESGLHPEPTEMGPLMIIIA